MRSLPFILVFYGAYLLLLVLGCEGFAVYMKPLLIPSLLFLFSSEISFSEHRFLLAAISFSAIGDVFLIFEGALFFVVGLFSFLLAHICYILVFKKAFEGIIWGVYLVLTSFIVLSYYLLFVSFLWPNLGQMQFPVLAYATVLALMLWFSLHSYKQAKRYRWFIVTGAFSFGISDSLLSYSLFYADFNQSHFYIMLTYVSAQLLLVYGILQIHKRRTIV